MASKLLINRADFNCITQVATHCDWDVMNIYIEESQNISLCSLIGTPFFVDILSNYADAGYKDLLDGSNYVGCDDKTYKHFGLKRVLVHYSYAEYVYRKGFVDTPFAVVQKMHRDSVPVPTTELRNLQKEHRRLAFEYWKMTQDYLCRNTDLFPLFDDCNCKPCSSGCGCDGECTNNCSAGKSKGIRRNRIKIISK